MKRDEEHWLSATDPRNLLRFAAVQASDRKLRLFAVLCCKTLVDVLDERGLRSLSIAEQFAEGLCSPEELEAARWEANDAFGEFDDSTPRGPFGRRGWESAADAVENICRREGLLESMDEVCVESAVVSTYDQPPALRRAMRRLALANQTRTFRDIFPNPFRPVAFDPRWRTADVIDIARGIYEQLAFERMPILADALMDAGCENEDIIAHCKCSGPHVHGCWVVDLILEKT